VTDLAVVRTDVVPEHGATLLRCGSGPGSAAGALDAEGPAGHPLRGGGATTGNAPAPGDLDSSSSAGGAAGLLPITYESREWRTHDEMD
jgi:hypothetical protein